MIVRAEDLRVMAQYFYTKKEGAQWFLQGETFHNFFWDK
jgi:hypothetical protein